MGRTMGLSCKRTATASSVYGTFSGRTKNKIRVSTARRLYNDKRKIDKELSCVFLRCCSTDENCQSAVETEQLNNGMELNVGERFRVHLADLNCGTLDVLRGSCEIAEIISALSTPIHRLDIIMLYRDELLKPGGAQSDKYNYAVIVFNNDMCIWKVLQSCRHSVGGCTLRKNRNCIYGISALRRNICKFKRTEKGHADM